MRSKRRSKILRIVKWTLGIVVAVAILVIFVVLPYWLVHFVTTRGTRPRDRALTTTPADYGVAYENVSFESEDGIRLSAWYLDHGKRGVGIVAAHGLFRSRREVLDRAVFLNEQGFDVLALDLRNHGESGKATVTLGYKERLDVEAGVRYLEERTRGEPVVLYGVSMGAAASLLAAAETPDVVAVVADSPFLNIEHTVAHHLKLIFGLPRFPFADIILFFLEARGGFRAGDFDVEKAVRKMGDRPVLIIAGSRDRRMPVAFQRRLIEASASPRSRFVVIEGATHGAGYRTDPEKYQEVLLKFLTTVVQQKEGAPGPHPDPLPEGERD